MAEHLPEDLIITILCLLPIKCLVGCKCVSKTWNTLISGVCVPRLLREPAPLCGFLFEAGMLNDIQQQFTDYVTYPDDNICGYTGRLKKSCDRFVESYSSLLPSQYSPYLVLDCCNGLILLVSDSVPRYFVCNPATKQCDAIPPAQVHERLFHAGLVFNPCESANYKVVRFLYTLSCSASKPLRLDIFSSETRKWIRCKVLIQPPVVYGVRWANHCVYWDGIMYKLTFSKHLLCFDLKALTTAQAIEVPCKEKFAAPGFIGVSRGVLHYANHDGSRLMIWQFDDHCKEGCFWILKHGIRIHDFMDKHPAGWELYEHRYCSMFMPYAIHPSEDIIILGVPHMTFAYDLKSGKLEKHCVRPFDRRIVRGQYSFFPYVQCFMSLKNLAGDIPNLHSCEQQDLLKKVVEVKPKRPRVSSPYGGNQPAPISSNCEVLEHLKAQIELVKWPIILNLKAQIELINQFLIS